MAGPSGPAFLFYKSMSRGNFFNIKQIATRKSFRN